MRKHFLFLVLIFAGTFLANAQSGRGIRIGYIDMEYILQNVPDYADSNNQLEQKAQKWKQEIEVKKNEITRLKESLKVERVLLTKELIEEREESITFLETELSDFQQKKFGPTGDLFVQKAVLVKPIQDQVFTAVQDIAEQRKYDFIFDKSSDLTMLFAAKRFDISDIVIRTITRSTKREQRSKKEIKADEAKEYQEDLEDANPALAERKKILEDKKAGRDKMVADRKLAAEEKKNIAIAKRQELLDEREAKKNGITQPKIVKKDGVSSEKGIINNAVKDSVNIEKEVAKKALTDAKTKTLEDRKKVIEERKAKILADREAIKKAKEEKAKEIKKE